MRWYYGQNYDPFETNMKEGLHPLPAFLKYNNNKIRKICFAVVYTLPALFIAFILRFIQNSFFNSNVLMHRKLIDN
jgi:hypothetical protein